MNVPNVKLSATFSPWVKGFVRDRQTDGQTDRRRTACSRWCLCVCFLRTIRRYLKKSLQLGSPNLTNK